MPAGTSRMTAGMTTESFEAHIEAPDALLARIEAAADAAHRHQDAYQAELERRNRAIVEAMDLHIEPRRIADAARLDVSRVHRIVAQHG